MVTMSVLTFPRRHKIKPRHRSLSQLSLTSVDSGLSRGIPVDTGSNLWQRHILDEYGRFDLPAEHLEDYIASLEQQVKDTCEGMRHRSATSGNVSCHDDLESEAGSEMTTVSRSKVPIHLAYALDLYHNMYSVRKRDLRELRLLQKLEVKQYQGLSIKAQYMREHQEKKSEQEMQTLIGKYDTCLESLNRQQKLGVEKKELHQNNDLKRQARHIHQEQSKDHRCLQEDLKQEIKLLKLEINMLPKEVRKETLRRRREQKEEQQQETERNFIENQHKNMEKVMMRLAEQHREKMALFERQLLETKQQLLRAREAAIWELEERHLQAKYFLAKRQFHDLFFLKNRQMQTRHEKEVEQTMRINTRAEEEMILRHMTEKKRLPKILKSDLKTRQQLLRQSLRIGGVVAVDQEHEKLRQFEQEEKERMNSEQSQQQLRHHQQWEDIQLRNSTAINELEQLQAEKRRLLMDQESQKMQELDETYKVERIEWRAQLGPRKQVLEEMFSQRLKEQETFYRVTLDGPAPQSISTSDIAQRSILSNKESTAM